MKSDLEFFLSRLSSREFGKRRGRLRNSKLELPTLKFKVSNSNFEWSIDVD